MRVSMGESGSRGGGRLHRPRRRFRANSWQGSLAAIRAQRRLLSLPAGAGRVRCRRQRLWAKPVCAHGPGGCAALARSSCSFPAAWLMRRRWPPPRAISESLRPRSHRTVGSLQRHLATVNPKSSPLSHRLPNRSLFRTRSTSATAPCVALPPASMQSSATAPCVALPPASMQSSATAPCVALPPASMQSSSIIPGVVRPCSRPASLQSSHIHVVVRPHICPHRRRCTRKMRSTYGKVRSRAYSLARLSIHGHLRAGGDTP
ncbi:MAG: hypothetical protein BMS9Abin10_1077 [Gammaproteobacteria bacterium]|nr:MAG: hypothetical protein BMS9Abin10_1077 [Gammaproteobacteria bacterium]